MFQRGFSSVWGAWSLLWSRRCGMFANYRPTPRVLRGHGAVAGLHAPRRGRAGCCGLAIGRGHHGMA